MAQQGRSVVEEHQIEPIARDLSTERSRQAPDRVLVRRGIRRVLLTEQHRDVDVALAPRAAARPASVQPGETHRGIVAQTVCEPAAKAGNVSFAGESGHARPSPESAFTTVARTRWPMITPRVTRVLPPRFPPSRRLLTARSRTSAEYLVGEFICSFLPKTQRRPLRDEVKPGGRQPMDIRGTPTVANHAGRALTPAHRGRRLRETIRQLDGSIHISGNRCSSWPAMASTMQYALPYG